MHVHADALSVVWFAALYLLVSAALALIELTWPDHPIAQALAVIH